MATEQVHVENACWGIGDAVMYCWMLHSAASAGAPVRFCYRRNEDVFRIFGVRDEWLTLDKARGTWHPPKGDGEGGWLRCWLRDYGIGEVPVVRPPYVEEPEAGEWAEKAWTDRDKETGSNTRVLIFPDVAWKIRAWPLAYYLDLANALANAGCNVIGMAGNEQMVKAMPYAFWGQDLPRVAAMIARADLVIGNDSGPAHIAGTIGTQTVAVVGGSRRDQFFDHCPEVVTVAVDAETVPCVGCNFKTSAGYRGSCDSGCRALYRLMPEDVYKVVMDGLAVSR